MNYNSGVEFDLIKKTDARRIFCGFERIHMSAVHCMTHCTSELINPVEIKGKVIVLSVKCFTTAEGTLLFGMFPGFVHSSLWQEQRVDGWMSSGQWWNDTDRGN
jgi:hypothetical protein